MTAKDAIKGNINMAHYVASEYLGDLTDDELRMCAVPGMNAIAWQLGHLIASENKMISDIGKRMPELPAGFAEHHSPEKAKDAAAWATKKTYQELLEKNRAATIAALEATPDAELDKPSPEAMRNYAPTIGAVFNLIGQHEMMHAGQWVAVRRKLNKPVKM
ncbi:MAG: DinB family protein [Phycisphaerae bacterium]